MKRLYCGEKGRKGIKHDGTSGCFKETSYAGDSGQRLRT